jgi:hypothetical protein
MSRITRAVMLATVLAPALAAAEDLSEDLSAPVYGHGAILEARVVDQGGTAAVAVRTSRGLTSIDLGYRLDEGTRYTVEDLALVDVVGDRNPEL